MNPNFAVEVLDPSGLNGSLTAAIKANALAAANAWGRVIQGSGSAIIDIQVTITQTSNDRASGGAGSFFQAGSGTIDGHAATQADPGSLLEITSGTDPNGAAPDIVINIDQDRLNGSFGSYWFDANPFDASHPIPADQVDGFFVMEHEIAHGLGFSGYRDFTTGAIGDLFTRYDSHVQFVDGKPYFNGANAVAAYGGLVPLTVGNLMHYGNLTGPGSDLVNGVVNGVVSKVGHDYQISSLDAAFLKDIGYTVDPALTLPAIPVDASASAQAVYRFFETSTGEHFYTTSPVERDAIIQNLHNYSFEGAKWAAPLKAADTVDVFRFVDTTTHSHLYTASAAERDAILQTLPTLKYEGVAFQAYADGSQAANQITLERFFNTGSGEHHFALPGEDAGIRAGAAGPNWVDEGPSLKVHALTADILI